MFTDSERVSLKALASTVQDVSTQIEKLSEFGFGAEPQVIDIMEDIRETLRRQEHTLQFIEVEVECRIV